MNDIPVPYLKSRDHVIGQAGGCTQCGGFPSPSTNSTWSGYQTYDAMWADCPITIPWSVLAEARR